mgnify:CR=1 FL=1
MTHADAPTTTPPCCNAGSTPPSAAVSALDPVCGMTVKPTTAHRAMQGGRGILFCGASCKDRFLADPEHYLRAAKDPVCGMEVDPKSAEAKATYKDKTYYFCSVADKDLIDHMEKVLVNILPNYYKNLHQYRTNHHYKVFLKYF